MKRSSDRLDSTGSRDDAGLRRRVFRLLEGDRRQNRTARWVQLGLGVLIVANVLAVVVESEPGLSPTVLGWLRAFEWASVAIFSVEYVLRVWVAVEADAYRKAGPVRGRVRYVLSPLAIIDLLAIAPSLLAMVFAVDLRQLRAFRLLRLLKLGHLSPSMALFGSVLWRQLPTLLGAAIVMLVLIVVSASFMFSAEHVAQPDDFGSVRQSIWWAVVTLTTVGYGDVTPVTVIGKLIAMVVMLLGVGTVAVPAALLAGKFSQELELRRTGFERMAEGAARDGRIDAFEKKRLLAEGRDAGLKEEDAEELLSRALRQTLQRRSCPHCGKALDG